MNYILIYIIVIIIIIIIIYCNNYINIIYESFTNNIEPSAICLINNGSISNVIITNKGYFNPNQYNIIISGGLTQKNYRKPILKFVENNSNNQFIDIEVIIVEPGYGYITPPLINFIPKLYINKDIQFKKQSNIPLIKYQNYYSQYLWNKLQTQNKDEVQILTQDYLRQMSYSDSPLTNQITNAKITNNKTIILYEFVVPIELYKINLLFYTLPKSILKQSITIKGYNSNKVLLFQKKFMYRDKISWKLYFNNVYLIQSLEVISSISPNDINIIGRQFPYSCEEIEDLLEQIKSAVNKKKPSSLKIDTIKNKNNDNDDEEDLKDLLDEEYEKRESEDIIYWIDVKNQLPNDLKNRDRKFLIYYFGRLLKQCNYLNNQQIKENEIMQKAEINAYKEQFKTKLQLIQEQRQKIIEEYLQMKAQYKADLEIINDAKKYKITPPPPKYTLKEIENKRKIIEKIESIPDDKIFSTCSRLNRDFQSKRKSAEKWAKASIFVPFLKNKAKQKSKQADKLESKYTDICGNFVELDYPETV